MSEFRKLLKHARDDLRADVALAKPWYCAEEELLVMLETTYKELDQVMNTLFARIETRLRDKHLIADDESFTPVKFNVLRTLYDFSPGWRTTIGDILVFNIDAPRLSEMLTKMREAEYIERRKNVDDGRVWEIRITPLGKKLLKVAEKDYLAILPQLFRTMNKTQRNDFLTMMHRFKSNLVALNEEY